MNFPQNLKYTNEHEWIRVEGDIAYVGITDYAQEQLGDIVFVDIPTVGETLEKPFPIFSYRWPARYSNRTKLWRKIRSW